MRAAVLERPGLDNLKIEQLPTPEPGPGEVLVRLRAASINYRDTLTVVGGYGSRQKQESLIPLSDGAGEVAAVGADVDRWRAGDRVIGCLMPNWQGGEMSEEKSAISLGGSADGCAAEYRLFPATGLVRTPEHLSFFKEDKEAVFFSSAQELQAKAKYYVEHPDEREAIARAGHERCVRSGNTHMDRVRKMLEEIG